jgi:hypothetical protein
MRDSCIRVICVIRSFGSWHSSIRVIRSFGSWHSCIRVICVIRGCQSESSDVVIRAQHVPNISFFYC